MEDALRVSEEEFNTVVHSKCLNPCSNGRCSARVWTSWLTRRGTSVLILVLMEDALRARERFSQIGLSLMVLILVLMEDALRDKQLQWSCNCESVLILVLMEDALREQKNMIEEVSKLS